ncbi:MAG: Asp-tRNA(Asn)/Glu-tRNA(Gln) amidotransferase subunit GatC [Mariprofundaceae bacterium]
MNVKQVAELARIRLTDEEAAEFGPQMEDIIGYVESMSALDTADVPPTAHPHDAAMPLRPDVVSNTNHRDELLAGAPLTEAGLFVVPKVIEGQ